MTKVFLPDAPLCPYCGAELVWDPEEEIWYCLDCGYYEESDWDPVTGMPTSYSDAWLEDDIEDDYVEFFVTADKLLEKEA